MRTVTMFLGGLRGRAPWMLAAATLVLAGCPLLEELLRPKLHDIEPAAGVPGTEVELQGQVLRNPFIDKMATVWFGDIPVRVRPSCEIADTPQPDLTRGCITLWNNDTIRFITPTNDIVPGTRQIRVETEGGFSEALTFQVQRGDGAAGARFDDFVGAVILEGDDKIGLFRMRRNDDEPAGPTLTLENWDDAGRRVTTVTYGRPGFTSTAWDLKLDSAGNLVYTLSALGNSGGDGVHQMVHLGGNYTVPITAREVGFDPLRVALSARWTGTDNSKLAVLSRGGAAVQVFDGLDFEPLPSFHLTAMGTDALPQAAHIEGQTEVFVVGRTPSQEQAWLALLDIPEQSLTLLDDTNLGDVDPVDVVYVSPSAFPGQASDYVISDVYVAYNDATGGALLRHRTAVTQTTSVTVSRLRLPPGYTVAAMALDDQTRFGTTPVPRLWLTIDDTDGERNDDFVLGLRVTGEFFPTADSDYVVWAAAVSGAVTDATPIPVAAFTELRSDCENCPPLVRDPLGISVLPSDTGPTFVLVANTGGDSVLVVRTDARRTVALLHDEYNLPGTLPTRISCHISTGG